MVRAVRYAPRWDRVCVRHGRWLLDANADQPHEYLDVRHVRRWPRRSGGGRGWRGGPWAGAEPERVFALAYAVVARWWEQAFGWERESIWPRRLNQVAGGDAGGDLERWRIVGRDAVVFPQVVAVADALLDPGMGELVWVDSGAGRPRALPADGMFCRPLGERVGRGWLGPLAATDHGGPLIAWIGQRHPSAPWSQRPRRVCGRRPLARWVGPLRSPARSFRLRLQAQPAPRANGSKGGGHASAAGSHGGAAAVAVRGIAGKLDTSTPDG